MRRSRHSLVTVVQYAYFVNQNLINFITFHQEQFLPVGVELLALNSSKLFPQIMRFLESFIHIVMIRNINDKTAASAITAYFTCEQSLVILHKNLEVLYVYIWVFLEPHCNRTENGES